MNILSTSLLFVECAGLVVVGTLGAADAGDDGGEQQQGGGHHRDPDDRGDAGPRLLGLVTSRGLGAAVAVEPGAAAVEARLPGPRLAPAEEPGVPDAEDVRVARAVL